MAGNAVGDFAATATGIGPLGEALGQLTETAVGAEGSIKEIAIAGAGMAGLAAAMYVVQKAMKAIADVKAFNAAQVDAYTEAIRDGATETEALVEQLTKAGKVMGSPELSNASNFLGLSDSVRDVTAQVTEAGLSIEQYARLATEGTDAIGAWGAAQIKAGADAKLILDVMALLRDEHTNLETATTNAATSALFFNDAQANTADGAKAASDKLHGLTGNINTATSALDKAEQAQKDLDAASRNASRAIDEQTAKFDALKDSVSDDQAWVDLQTAFDQVRDSATEAWDKSKAGADDAAAAVRAHTSDTNALKLAIIDYGVKVLGLPAEQVTNIVTHVNDTELDQLERRLETIKRNAAINVQIIDKGGAGYGPITGGPRSAPVPSMTAAAAPARWARINGR
jgi:hypothetical protein